MLGARGTPRRRKKPSRAYLQRTPKSAVTIVVERPSKTPGAGFRDAPPTPISRHAGLSRFLRCAGLFNQSSSVRLALRLGVVGLINVQFAVGADEELYVIEANPRASRTVPFVSKAVGVPLAKLGWAYPIYSVYLDNPSLERRRAFHIPGRPALRARRRSEHDHRDASGHSEDGHDHENRGQPGH